MVESFAEVALEQIEAADLPSTIYRTARRLLDRAARAEGTLILSEAELMTICQTEAAATMRSHLVQMAGVGIIRYSRRGTSAYIQFDAWANPELPWHEDAKLIAERSIGEVGDEDLIAQRSISDTDNEKVIAERSNRALSDQNGSSAIDKSDRSAIKSRAERSNRALSDQNGADSLIRARGRALVGGGLSDPSTTKRSRKKPTTNQPPLADAHQQLAFELLVDREVGVDYEVAQILARSLPLLDIYRVVDDWLPDRRAGKVRPAALCYRLERAIPSSAPTVNLSADFRNSDLYRRHQLPAEMVAGQSRRRYSLEAADDP